jgi:hypothetical protein
MIPRGGQDELMAGVGQVADYAITRDVVFCTSIRNQFLFPM